MRKGCIKNELLNISQTLKVGHFTKEPSNILQKGL